MNLNGLVLENVLQVSVIVLKLLLFNFVQCTYYKQVLAECSTYQQIVDEIYMHVSFLFFHPSCRFTNAI